MCSMHGVAKLKAMYVPGAFVTVDEQIVPFCGRAGFVQYMPNKPDPYGIKNWLTTDSYTFHVYNMQVLVVIDTVQQKSGRGIALSWTSLVTIFLPPIDWPKCSKGNER